MKKMQQQKGKKKRFLKIPATADVFGTWTVHVPKTSALEFPINNVPRGVGLKEYQDRMFSFVALLFFKNI